MKPTASHLDGRGKALPPESAQGRSPTTYTITLKALPSNIEDATRLRIALKVLLRRFDFRCVSVSEAPTAEPTFSIRFLLDELQISSATLSSYASIGGISTPKRGQHNHRFTRVEVAAICNLIIKRCPIQRIADRARALANQKEIKSPVLPVDWFSNQRMNSKSLESTGESA